MATSAFTECLVGPSRLGAHAVAIVDDLFTRLPIETVDLDADTASPAL